MNIVLLERTEVAGPLAAGDPRARHILRVLGARVGEVVRAGIVDGPLGELEIEDITDGAIGFCFAKSDTPPPELEPIEVILGHPRPIVLRRMLRDLTALGVRRILVSHTDLGERSYYESRIWEQPRAHLVDGAAQACTTRLPLLQRVNRLNDALAACADGTRIALHPDQSRCNSSWRLPKVIAPPVTIAIGSERGWTDSEIRQITAAGFSRVDLGARILRTETACTAAVSLVRAALAADTLTRSANEFAQ